MTGKELNSISEGIIGAAIEVHRELGPGLLEHCYEACLDYELQQRGFQTVRQMPLPVNYKNTRVDCGFRIDLLVNETVVIELKSIDKIAPIHEAQLMTYLKLTKCRLGLILNFNVTRLTDGVRRIVHDFPD